MSIFLSLSLTLSPCLSFNLLVPLHQTLYLRFNLSLYTYLSLLLTFSASSAALYVNLFLYTYLSFSLSVYILSLRFLSLTSQLFPLSSSSTTFSSFLFHLFLSLLLYSLPLFVFFYFSITFSCLFSFIPLTVSRCLYPPCFHNLSFLLPLSVSFSLFCTPVGLSLQRCALQTKQKSVLFLILSTLPPPSLSNLISYLTS